MKQLLLLLVLFSTSLSFSVTTEELARQIRSGSAEDAIEAYSKSYVKQICWYLNVELRCLASSNNTNEASACIDKVQKSNKYKSIEKRYSFLNDVLSEERERRSKEFEAFETKIRDLKDNLSKRSEWKKFKENSYHDEMSAFSLRSMATTLKKMQINQQTKEWLSLTFVSSNKFEKCSEKKEKEFKCLKKEILSITKEVNAMYSCHEF